MAQIKPYFATGICWTAGTYFNLIQMEIQFLSSSPRKQSSPQPSTGKERSTNAMFVIKADCIFYQCSGYVCFWPLGSESVSHRYGSGSLYHQSKIVRNTFIPTVLWLLYYFLSFKNDVNVPSKSYKQKNLLAAWRSMTKYQYPDPLVRGADPDPYQNVTDPQHCIKLSL